MRLYLFVPALLLGLTNLPAQALTKQAFISLVKQTPGYEEISLQVSIAEQQKDSYEGSEDWLFSTGISQSERDDSDNLITQSDADSARTISSGLSRLVLDTGGEITLTQEWTKNEYNERDGDYNDTELSLAYLHPLLKDKAGVLSSLERDLSRYDLQMARSSAQSEAQSFIVEKLQLFFDWMQYQQQLEINETQLLLAHKQLARTQRKYQNKLVNEVDVLLQKDLVLAREQAILNIEQSLFSVKKLASELFNNPSMMAERIELDLDESITLPTLNTLENTAKFKRLKLDIARTKRQLKTLENSEEAELDLSLSVAREGQDGNAQDAFGNVSTDYTLGLNYQYPLGNRRANSERFKVEFELQEKELSYRQQLADDVAQLASLAQQMNMLKAQIELTDKRVSNAIKTSKEQQKRYDNAQIDVSFVIDALDNEQQITLEKLNYQIQYQKAHYDYALMLNLVQ